MEERAYANYSDESLIIGSHNLINEINAFMGHHFVSERKIEQLSARVDEFVFELNLRSQKWNAIGDNEDIKEMLSIISQTIENLKSSINNLKQKVIQIQPVN